MAVSRAAATAKFKARPGTFGDVFKYSFLTRLLAHQRGPNRPFTFVDVFGGTGVAQLAGLRKAHGPSAVDDLWSLFGHPRVASKLTGTGKQIFQEVAPFVKALRRYNPAAYTATTELSEKLEQAAAKTNLPSKTTDILNQMPGLEYLPRAPLIGAYMMRHQDNATFVEENPENFEVLSELFKTDRRVKVFNGKPEQLARALLPTRTHKGLMFMDPDYSLTETRARVTEVISSSFHRWPGGTYAVYYPFDPEVKVWVFEELKKVGFRNILGVEINFAPQWPDVELVAKLAPFHVGMAIVNAPYNFDSEAEQLCENLLRLFMPHFEQPHLPHWNALKRGLPIFSAEDQRIVDEKLISDHMKRCVNIFWGTDKMPLQLFDQSDTTTNLDVKRITEHTLHEENSLLNLARNRGQKLEDSRLNSQLRSRKKGDDKKSSVEYISLKPAHAEEFFVTMDPRSKNYKTRVPTNIAIEPPINEVDDIMVSGPSSGRKFVEKIAHYDVKRHESTRLVDPIEEDEKERAARLVQAAEAGAKLLEQAQKEAAAAPKQ